MDAEAREIELKFRLDPERGADILAHLGAKPIPAAHTLTSIYFDTPRRLLRRSGVVLRVRHDGRQWTQTVKAGAGADGNLGRREWEMATPTGAPDLAGAHATPAAAVLARAGRLAPLFTVVIKRRKLKLEAHGGVIEASVDHGEVIAGCRASPVDELELELKAGPIASLFAVARQLQQAFDLELSFVTKADRGFALFERRHATARHFESPKLTRAMSAASAFKAIARAGLEQIAGNVDALRQAPDAEAVHQMRVGVRRLLGALSTFKTVVADDRKATVRANLKWLAGELDAARNLDVFLAGPWRRARRDGEGAAAATALGRRLRDARAAAYARARAAIDAPAFRTLLLETLAWIEAGPWVMATKTAGDEPIASFAARALTKTRRQVIAKGRGLRKLDRHSRHRVRVKAKGLRYGADVFGQLFEGHPRRAPRFLHALKEVLGDLGDLNDIATCEGLAAQFPPAGALIVGQARRERFAAKSADRAFDAFKAVEPYWRGKT